MWSLLTKRDCEVTNVAPTTYTTTIEALTSLDKAWFFKCKI